jgi:signal transduction histidine kinase
VKDKTEYYLHEALKTAEKCNNKNEKATVYRLLGSLYCEYHKTDTALSYLFAAEKILMQDEGKNLQELSLLHAVIGETYFEKEHTKSQSLLHFQKAVAYGERSKDKNATAFSLIKLGRYNTYAKKYSEAESCFRKARKLYHEIDVTEGEMYALTELALSKSKASGNTEIFDLMKEVELLKDTLFKKETATKIAEYEVSFETSKKEAELKAQALQLKRQQEKTTLYIVFSGFVFVTFIVVFILYSRNSKNKQGLALLESKLKERQRIARDLHDNLGSNVSYILSKSGKLLEDDSENKQEDIMEIKDAARGIMSNLRESIWLLNKQEVSNTELADKLKQYIKKNLLTTHQISESIKQEKMLPSETAMSIYRCVQETITNINKHSKATDAAIHIYDSAEHSFAIQVSDNGNGFEYADHEGHYGLRNMKARMEEIHASLSIQSNKDEGTTILIQYG